MIFYFSATGITKKLALTIAERTQERAIDIEQALAKEEFTYTLQDSERLGFLSPVYFGGVPDIVKRFIEHVKVQTGEHYYCFIAMTFGTGPFNATNQLVSLLLRHGITTNAMFGACGIDTYLPMFTIPDGDARAAMQDKMNTQNALIAEQVADRTAINDIRQGPFPRLTSACMAPLYALARRTGNFHVSDACTGCGLCVKKCPERAIALDTQTKRPVWNAPKCLACLRCLHHCPTAAIDHGRSTNGKLRLKSYP